MVFLDLASVTSPFAFNLKLSIPLKMTALKGGHKFFKSTVTQDVVSNWNGTCL